MIAGMAASAPGGRGSLRMRAARGRDLHVTQLRSYGFFAGRGPRPSATVLPAPLRYWQYEAPPGTTVLFVVVVVAIWLGVFGWLGGASEVRSEAPLALGIGLVVLLLNIRRTTVSEHGLSIDAAGRRTDVAEVIPLVLVREVRVGAPPEDWPPVARRGGRWPGRAPVAVRHLDEDGDTERVFTHWVRDPGAFAAALGGRL